MIETRFKDTEVGKIPEDWETCTLDSLCYLITKQTGFDYSSSIKPFLVTVRNDTTLSFIQNKDFEGHRINYNTDFFIPRSIANRFPNIKLDEPLLLVSISGRIGNVGYFQNEKEAFVGGAVGVARFKNKKMIEWVMLFLQSSLGQEQIFKCQKVGAQHNITVEDVRKLLIPITSLKEQSAIAKALSNIDALISELGNLIEKKRAIKQGAMQQLLTGKKRLKGFTNPWIESTLGENILFLRTGLNPRVHFKLNTADADGFYITVRELKGFNIVVDEQTDRINHQAVKRINERSSLEKGDVLFSGTGTIGQTALVKEDSSNWGIKEGIYAITPNHKTLDSLFLIYYLHSSAAMTLFSSMSSGSTINSVPMSKLSEMPITLPSLFEQSAISSVLSSMDEEISALEAKREKYIAIKQGMMQQLLTGKIRLID